jgi:hypothetical protein
MLHNTEKMGKGKDEREKKVKMACEKTEKKRSDGASGRSNCSSGVRVTQHGAKTQIMRAPSRRRRNSLVLMPLA